jgi:hypothetical protein
MAIANRSPKESSDFPCLLPFAKKIEVGVKVTEVINQYVLSIFAVDFQ